MSSLNHLRSTGIHEVSYPGNVREAVILAMSFWRRFCDLAQSVKRSFDYSDLGNLDGVGYEFKNTAGETADRKETFHFTTGTRSFDGSLVNDERGVCIGFLQHSHRVVEAIAPIVSLFAREVENQFNIPGLHGEVMGGQYNWFLRYIHYFGDQKAGDVIAKPHADKAGFTLHLYESHPGLQHLPLGDKPGVMPEWAPMLVSHDNTVIIPGMQLQYKSNSQLTALCHRVVANVDTAEAGRYSMVCFIPFLQTAMFNKQKLGRLQDMSPGFNYAMPPQEFAALFA